MTAPLTAAQEAAAIRATTQEMIATLEAVNEKLCRVIAELDAVGSDGSLAAITQEAAATAATATPAAFAATLIARIQNLKTPPPSPK